MSMLRRKLRRDLARSRRQFAAVTVMVFLGIAFFVGLLGSMDNLRLSIDRPYRDLRFADFTVEFEWAPRNIVENVDVVPGVDRVTGRVNVELPISFPGRTTEVIIGRILSFPAPDRPAVNDILITEGQYLTRSAGDEVVVEKNFAAHHGLQVGDQVEVKTPVGPWIGRVVGLAISPEYLWPARSLPEHMPDVLRRWGVLFLANGSVESLLGVRDVVNEVAVSVLPEADPSEVTRAVSAVLEPYRLNAVVPRAEQPSQAFLDSLVGALDTLSVIFPLFFLVIVALSTYMLLTRLVHSQRQQIGVVLALGFSRRRVLAHYLGFSLVIGLIGSLLGIVGGYLLAGPVTDLFASRVSLPLVYKVPHWDTMVLGVALSVVFTSAAGILPAYRASWQRPAETMRGEVPAKGTLRFRHRNGSVTGHVSSKLPYRNLRRNPVRTVFTILALALAGSVVLVPLGFLDTMDSATQDVLRSANYDLSAQMYRPVPENVTGGVGVWPGVEGVEPYIFSPTLLLGGGASYNMVLYGLREDSEYYRLFSRPGGERVYPADDGILLASIFEKRGLRIGDAVKAGPLETRVSGFVTDYSTNGYLPLPVVQQAMGVLGLVNGLFLRLQTPSAEDDVKAGLYAQLPVWSVAGVAKTLQDWNDMLRLYYGFIGVIVAFGVVLAGAIVFNTVTINVLERDREIATMRTLGVRGFTIARVITVENVLVLAASVVLGSIVGFLLTGYLVTLFGGDIFVLDVKIAPLTFAVSAGLLLGALLASEVPSLRHVQRLDLARATKERVG